MIGSFWNLCRACPSRPVDKLHSEYRSTYRWHEYTGPRQEVVRRPPQSASGGNNAPGPEEEPPAAPNNPSVAAAGLSNWEPPLPRKKKHPDLAYRAHEFIMSEGSDDSLDSTVGFDRARSEERTGRRMRPSRRSKSEGPPTRYGGGTGGGTDCFQSEYRLQYSKILAAAAASNHNNFQPDEPDTSTTLFAWPRQAARDQARETAAAGLQQNQQQPPPRKSLSMGAIRAQTAPHAPVPVHHAAAHRMRRLEDHEAAVSELEPLVAAEADFVDGEEKILEEISEKPKKRKEFKTEYKKRFRPFSQYEYVDGKFNKRKGEADMIAHEPPPPPVADLTPSASDPWYREVIELRKKAGEYKHRGWGTELVPDHLADLYGKQVVLWEQVSRRSSLSALSLASASPRPITKEEKEKENSKKSSPSKALTKFPGRADRVDGFSRNKTLDKEPARSRKEFLIRHHLERTTGAEDGALLVSPTREKLEPVIPRRKEEDSSNKSPSKGSPKSSPRSGAKSCALPARSQSVGPSVSENRSPKRQPRTPVSASSAASAAPKQNGPIERRPRPTEETSPLLKRAVFQAFCNSAPSLNTTSSATRSKSSSVAMRNSSEAKLGKNAAAAATASNAALAKAKKAAPSKPIQAIKKADDDKISGGVVGGGDLVDAGVPPLAASDGLPDLPTVHTQKATPPSGAASDTKEVQELLSPDTNNTTSLLDDEPLIKSPPEPTRVKSPEQIIMRSPEPVNWTVPLDTGKTFTVTQNVREADPAQLLNKAARGELSRPHGESSRHWGAPASSLETSFEKVLEMQPQEVADEGAAPTVVLIGAEPAADISDHSEATPPTQKSAAPAPATPAPPPVAAIKAVAGTTLKCLDDPDFDPAPSRPPPFVEAAPTTASAPPPARQGYRILEAPDSPPEVPNARSVASDVLEKARNRFDMFWGKDGKL